MDQIIAPVNFKDLHPDGSIRVIKWREKYKEVPDQEYIVDLETVSKLGDPTYSVFFTLGEEEIQHVCDGGELIIELGILSSHAHPMWARAITGITQ